MVLVAIALDGPVLTHELWAEVTSVRPPVSPSLYLGHLQWFGGKAFVNLGPKVAIAGNRDLCHLGWTII